MRHRLATLSAIVLGIAWAGMSLLFAWLQAR